MQVAESCLVMYRCFFFFPFSNNAQFSELEHYNAMALDSLKANEKPLIISLCNTKS